MRSDITRTFGSGRAVRNAEKRRAQFEYANSVPSRGSALYRNLLGIENRCSSKRFSDESMSAAFRFDPAHYVVST